MDSHNNLLHKGTLLSGLLASVLIISGCAPSHPLMKPEDAAALSTPDYTYKIGAGDNINFFVWRNPDISQTLPVRPDGKISAPLVEELYVSGKTPYQVARDIEKELSKYIKEPIVTVMVTGFVGPYDQQVRIVGQAAKPQAIPYKIGMTTLDVMIAVGGLTEFAAGNNASVVRMAEGKQKQFGVRLDDLIKDGDITANVQIKPGDIVIIPESWF